MSHFETLIVEYLDWQGYLVRRNIKVGRLKHGGWEMELDVIGFHPVSHDLVHYEPSVDAHPWEKREKRYLKKFSAARKLIFKEVFPWLPPSTPLRQIAIFPTHPKGRKSIAGGGLISIDEFVAEVRNKVMECGAASRGAISENYPLLRTIQFSHCGYTHAKFN